MPVDAMLNQPSFLSSLFHNRLDHLVANLLRLGESWREILLYLLKFYTIGFKRLAVDKLAPILQEALALLSLHMERDSGIAQL
jgi:hypothetical protein